MKRPDHIFSDPSVEEWAVYIGWALGQHASRAGPGWDSNAIINGLGIPAHKARKALVIADREALVASTAAYGITTYGPHGYDFQRRGMTDKQYRVLDAIRHWGEQPLSIKRISEIADVRQGGTPYQLENLERKGLITSERVGYKNHATLKNTYRITARGLSEMQYEDEAIRLGYPAKGSEVFIVPRPVLHGETHGEVCDEAAG